MRLRTWSLTVLSLLILLPAGIGVYIERQYLPVVGVLVLVSLCLLVVGGLITAGVFIARLFTRVDHYEIGPSGSLLHHSLSGRITAITPLDPTQKALPAPDKKVVIPKLAEIIAEGLLGTSDLLLGYTTDGEAYWGSWNDIRTFAIGGKGRTGKTVTMFFLIV